MSAAEIIEAIIDELGIRKVVTQGSKTAKVEYTLTAGATGEFVRWTSSLWFQHSSQITDAACSWSIAKQSIRR